MTRKSGLADSPLFLNPSKSQKPTNPPTSQEPINIQNKPRKLDSKKAISKQKRSVVQLNKRSSVHSFKRSVEQVNSRSSVQLNE